MAVATRAGSCATPTQYGWSWCNGFTPPTAARFKFSFSVNSTGAS